MSQQDPIRVFVTHAWEDSDDYLRVFEYLESAKNFFYRNLASTELQGARDVESQRKALRAQIGAAEVVIGLASLNAKHSDLLSFEMVFAQGSKKPVMLLPPFGQRGPLPRTLTEFATEIVEWDERAIADAVRRLARGETSSRWDVVEFKLD